METREPLDRIADTLEEILQLLRTFTNDGLPLKAQVPTSELLSSLLASLAAVLQEGTPLPEVTEHRLQAAQALGDRMVAHHDEYQGAKARRIGEILLSRSDRPDGG